MAGSVESFRLWAQTTFCPLVVVQSSEEARQLCALNNLTPAELLRPFGSLSSPVSIRSIDRPFTLYNFTVRFLDCNEAEQPPPEYADRLLDEVIQQRAPVWDWNAFQIRNRADVDTFIESGMYRTPWFDSWHDAFFDTLRCSDHEFFDHPLGIVFMVSSRESHPVQCLDALSRLDKLPTLFQRGVYDPNIHRSYIILHDPNQVSDQEADDKLRVLKQSYPAAACRILRINSLAATKAPNSPPLMNIWGRFIQHKFFTPSFGPPPSLNPNVKPTTPYGMCMSQENIDELRTFVQDFVFRQILPFLESRMRHLDSNISSARKGFKNQLKYLWRKPKNEVDRFDRGDSSYQFNSIEAQIRQLADFAFLIQDYELALANYKTVLSDFKSDKAWKYFAGVNEMIAVCSVLTDTYSRNKDVDSYIDSAYSSYMRAEVKRYAARATLFGYDVYRCLDNKAKECSAALLRASTDFTETMWSALYMEQAAHMYLFTTPPQFRKYIFHLIFAGHIYQKAGYRRYALRCYASAAPLFSNRKWVHIEDHINYNLSRQTASLSDLDASLRFGKMLLVSRRQTAEKQNLYLQQFEAVVRACLGGDRFGSPGKQGSFERSISVSDRDRNSVVMALQPGATSIDLAELGLPVFEDASIRVVLVGDEDVPESIHPPTLPLNSESSAPLSRLNSSSSVRTASMSPSTYAYANQNQTGIQRRENDFDVNLNLNLSTWSELGKRTSNETLGGSEGGPELTPWIDLASEMIRNELTYGTKPVSAPVRTNKTKPTFDLSANLAADAGGQPTAAPLTTTVRAPVKSLHHKDLAKRDEWELKLLENWDVNLFAKYKRSAVVCEPIHVHVNIENPLQVEVKIQNLHLVCGYESESITDSASEPVEEVHTDVGYSVENQSFTLSPREKRCVQLLVHPTRIGSFRIKGVTWTLQELVNGSHTFQLRGKRLHKGPEQKSEVPLYAPDLRLTLDIVPSMPQLRFTFVDLPDAMLCGEIRKVTLQIKNESSYRVGPIKMTPSHRQLFCFSYEGFENASTVVDPDVVPLRGMDGGETVNLPVWIRGYTAGAHVVRFLLRYSGEVVPPTPTAGPLGTVKGPLKHRWGRLETKLEILPSISIQAFSQPSFKKVHGYIIGFQVENALKTSASASSPKLSTAFSLHQLSCIGSGWKLEALQKDFPTEFCQVPPGSSTNLYFTLTPSNDAQLESCVQLDSRRPPVALTESPVSDFIGFDKSAIMQKQKAEKEDPLFAIKHHKGGAVMAEEVERTSVDLILFWSTPDNSVRGQLNHLQLPILPRSTGDCPLKLVLDAPQFVSHDFSSSSLCVVSVRVSIKNASPTNSVSFEVETLRGEETFGPGLEPLPRPHYFWVGKTQLQICELAPGAVTEIMLQACFQAPGVYNLNRFRFLLQQAIDFSQPMFRKQSGMISPAKDFGDKSPSSSGTDSTRSTRSSRAFFFPFESLIHIEPASS